jgi:hypothetical protein
LGGARVRRCTGGAVHGLGGARVRRCTGGAVHGWYGARVGRCTGVSDLRGRLVWFPSVAEVAHVAVGGRERGDDDGMMGWLGEIENKKRWDVGTAPIWHGATGVACRGERRA